MVLAGEVADLRVIALLDDYAGFETSLYGQHGIALLVELYSGGETRRILLDTGQEAAPILHNMEILGIDPAAIDCIFLSHCHYDHTGGLAGILRAIGREIPVVAHPELFRENYIRKPFLRHIGVSRENSPEAIRAAGGHLLLTGEAFAPMPGVFSTGEVPRRVAFEDQAIGTYNLEGGRLTLDNLRDDMSLVVNVSGRGLVILTGCGHAGIINIINQARKIAGIRRVAGVIGGFHLIEAGEERIRKTAAALAREVEGLVVAGHCTGPAACSELARVLGDRFQLLHAGKTVVFS
ncbi:MAG TPA: MBL fold metallo-hydrolase [Firmicutes bacterium]|nr:MBL fold metallo-hydrolase [Bacillota bacterium]